MMSDTLRVALLGADSLLLECGERLLAQGHEIVVVAAGSERVSSWARRHGLATCDASGAASEWGPGLGVYTFDWLLVITHEHIVPDDVLALAVKGAIGLQDSPLPTHRGRNTPAFGLLRGDRTWGITWHLMDAGDDEGDILVSRAFEIAPGETSLSLNTRNFEAALDAFDELVSALAADALRPVPQPHDATSTHTAHSDRPSAAAILDWRSSAESIDRLVRALTFGPYPNPLTTPKLWGPAGMVAVTGIELADDADGAAGEVLSISSGGIVVGAADGAVRVTGCASLRGIEMDITGAASVIGIAVGDRLPLLDHARVDSLGVAMQTLAGAEQARLADLIALEPVEVPWASIESAPGTPTDFHSVEVWPTGEAAVAAAFAVVLARVSGKQRFHVAVASPDRAGDDDLIAAIAEQWRPLALEVPADAPLDVIRDQLAETVSRASESASFAVDLVGRHPALAGNPVLQAGRALPTAIRVDRAGDPVDGVVLELERSDGRWRLRFDSMRIARSDIDVLVAAIRMVGAADGADQTVADVDLLGPDLRALVLDRWNDTAIPYEHDLSVHELVARQAQRTPNVTALVCDGDSLTYAELDARTNRLARYLMGMGVEREDLVGVHVERSIDLVVAALGVLKAGAAYVPLDPTYPHDRLAHMISDSGCRVIVTQSSLADGGALPVDGGRAIVQLDADRAAIGACSSERPDVEATSDQVAYCIYTSGSTGLPKGVLVEHRNVVNFFVGMDEPVPHELPAIWYAVTSLSFDISVLELFYTLTRGFTVVIHVDHDRSELVPTTTTTRSVTHRPMDFSLFYFSGDAASEPGPERYRLLLEGARFADEHGFRAVWTPERHFHSFGGLFPEPSVTGAAVAAITSNVEIRAGSVVMPLHHPARVAEAWSVIDNISGGRVGISVASGWQPNDFVLLPQNYAAAKQVMFDHAEILRRLWRGEAVEFDGPLGPVEVCTLPSPVQAELPLWVTTAGTLETYVQAGRMGANVLTHLLGQSIEQLAPKIDAYRRARTEGGHDPDAGVVSLMLHTFVADDEEAARAAVREPLKEYLATSFSLLKEYAWSYPAFARPAGSDASDLGDDEFKALAGDELDAVLEYAFLRYYETSGLFGSRERCLTMVDELKAIGVDEIACLVDFGVATDSVLASLPALTTIKDLANEHVGTTPANREAGDVTTTGDDPDHSVAAQIHRHGVTHLQCTPSMARMFTLQDDTREALRTLHHMFVGGEALPTALAAELTSILGDATLTNMYGPTETTIWSTTWPVPRDVDRILIGTPIANTAIYVLDRDLQPTLPGVPGDLWIGGDGVVRGYHERPELTAERFVTDPHRGAPHRMYCTGDLARWVQADDGSPVVEFLGRIDHQVKVRGYRIELGEIETQLGRYPGVRENVVVVRGDDIGDQQLVAFVSATPGAEIEPPAVREQLRETLPDVMVPAHIVVLDDLPHTPNGKIDRNSLPALADVLQRRSGEAPVAPGSDTERQVLAVWHEVLGNTDVGVNDNFFDVGGHSLLVVRVHRLLKERLARPIALTELYRFPTVRSFASALDAEGDSATVQTALDRAQRRRQRRARG